MGNKIKKFTVYDLVIVGVMAAIIFTLTYFIKIPISTPAGPTMIKVANAFCLLAGILFGGFKGGLAAGIGSMIYDLLDPLYITSAPITLVLFFLMAFICGAISHCNGKNGMSNLYNTIGAAVGAFSYVILYFAKSVITKTVETVGFSSVIFSSTGGEAFKAAFVACLPKLATSAINAVIAVVIACLLAPALKLALKRTGFYDKSSLK